MTSWEFLMRSMQLCIRRIDLTQMGCAQSSMAVPSVSNSGLACDNA